MGDEETVPVYRPTEPCDCDAEVTRELRPCGSYYVTCNDCGQSWGEA